MSFVGSIALGSGTSTQLPGFTRGRMQGGANGINYPSPFFDIAHTYLPVTVKQMFRWCRYYFLTNPLINATVFKLSEYPVTDIIIDHADAKVRKRWEEYFHDHLRFRALQIETGLDYHAYGNSLNSLGFPFKKYLRCVACRYQERADKIRHHWVFTNTSFRLTCPQCGNTAEAEAYDIYYKNPSGINIIRWNCEHIEINYNEVTGDTTHFYTIPPQVRNDIVIGKKDIVETIPQIFIQAIRQQKGIVFSKEMLFHMKRATLAQQDRGWGIPLILPVLKDTFYLQLMKKAQEAILLEHIVPLRLLFPQAGSGASDPYVSVNLADWRDHVGAEIKRWRYDNNYIPIMPLPIGNQTIGGDGRALLLTQEIQIWSEHIMVGMGVPKEFLLGGMCLTPDSLVQTDKGLLRLDEIVPELENGSTFNVRSHKGVRTATQGHRVGKKKVWKLKTRLGLELTGAGTHPVFRLAEGFKLGFEKIESLKIGSFVGVSVGSTHAEHNEKGLDPESENRPLWQACPVHLKFNLQKLGGRFARADLAEIKVPDVVTPSLARVLGYLMAEGSCTSSRRYGFSITDADVAQDFESCVHETFGLNLIPSSYALKNGLYQYEISRQTVVEMLQQLGLRGDSYEKVVPHVIRRADANIVSAFLSAYFEGDGGVSVVDGRACVHLTSCSERALQEVQLLLLNMGVVASRYPSYGGKSAGTLQIRGKQAEKFFNRVGFISARKRSALITASPQSDDAVHNYDRIPFLRDALLVARNRHVHGFGSWRFEPVNLELNQQSYTVKEASKLLSRDPSTLGIYIRRGVLHAEYVSGSDGKFGRYVISRDSLQSFLSTHGLGQRRTFHLPQYEYTYQQLESADLEAVRKLEPELYEKIDWVKKSKLIWDEVVSIEELEIEEEMLDIGVEGAHSYQASGVLCHNSYAGTNVSMRMLENAFLGYIENQKRFANWIMQKVSSYLGWPRASVRFKPFKMADDLQRKAYLFQLNQANKISDTTLLADTDLNQEDENDIMIKETKARHKAMLEQQIAMAEIQGEASVVMAKYQAKAQQVTQAVMMSPPAPGEPGDGEVMGGVPAGMQSSLNAGQDLGAPEGQEQGAVDIQQLATMLAEQYIQLSPDEQQMAMNNLQAQSPELAELVLQEVHRLQASGAGPQAMGGALGASVSQVDTRPLPEQRAPRRMAAAV